MCCSSCLPWHTGWTNSLQCFTSEYYRSAARMSIDTNNNLIFHYLLRDTLCYLTLTEQSYPKRLAFLYLEEIADSFLESLANDHGDRWRDAVDTTARPYAFIKFEQIIQRKRKDFIDPTSRQNTTKLNEDLADIQSIMRTNINEVLNRGKGKSRIQIFIH